jgi:FkbM family methyltransferase
MNQAQTSSLQKELETVEYPFTTAAGKILKFFVPKGDIIGSNIRMTRHWDYTFISHLYLWGSKRGSYVEVGANIGTDSALAREFFNVCYAFEPSSLNRELFVRNMERNGVGEIKLLPFAVSDRAEMTRLYLPRNDNVGGCSLMGDEGETQQWEEVRTVTLDAAMPPEVTDVGFIQIDTEGHDIKVLRGARQFLGRLKEKPIIKMEFQPRALKSHGSDVGDLTDFIKEFGYQIGINASMNMAPLSERVLTDLFELWQPTDAWLDIYLLP